MAVKSENTRISVTMSKKMYIELLELAEYEDRSVSNLILSILKDHLSKNEKK